MHAVDAVVKHRTEVVNGIKLHWVEAGDGPLVVLLHGFPEFWYSWRNQIPVLADAGYRVVAPDMRGYNESDKPRGYEAYLGTALSDDVSGLIAACDAERAVVVGHDWGGVAAWMTAIRHPEVLHKLVVMNAPHPAVFLRAIRTPGQIVRSSYIAAFQTPVVPEIALRARNFALLKRALRRGALRADAFTDSDLDRYAEAFSKPGALTATLAYYRAMGRRIVPAARQSGAVTRDGRSRTVTAPTLVIWGRHDPVLGPATADPGDFVPNRRVELIEASHFVQSDAPERVNDLLVDFLAAEPL